MQKESEGVLELQIGGAVYMLGVFFFKVSSPFHFLSMVQVSMCCADTVYFCRSRLIGTGFRKKIFSTDTILISENLIFKKILKNKELF